MKVLAELLVQLETDYGDPRDQDSRDVTLAAQGEDCGEQSLGETRRSEERRAAAPRRKEDRAGQVRAAGEAETWGDQRQGDGSACHEGVAVRGDPGGGAKEESGLTTLTRPTLNQPLTEMLGHLSLALTLLLLAPTTTRASTLRSRPTTTGPATSTAATPSAASTAATRASTSATGPTAATTSTAFASSTAAPTTTPTATSTTTAASSTTPATLALAVAALRTSRSNTDVLRNRDVSSSSRGEGGGKGGGGAPLKEG
ncbi:unnamed protein product [Closterium sp. NIES-65]|nr:unnamed protein product [Closterium sp. NIES-65]